MSMDGWMDKENVSYTYNRILLSLKKKKKNPVIYNNWMNLEDIILSEINQIQKNMYYVIPLIWGI